MEHEIALKQYSFLNPTFVCTYIFVVIFFFSFSFLFLDDDLKQFWSSVQAQKNIYKNEFWSYIII